MVFKQHAKVLEEEGKEEKEGNNGVLGDKTDGKKISARLGIRCAESYDKLFLYQKGTLKTSFLCCFLLLTQKDLCQH